MPPDKQKFHAKRTRVKKTAEETAAHVVKAAAPAIVPAPAPALSMASLPERKGNITREDVMERLWQLAALPASDTKDNINGQVRAASALAEILGMKITRAAGLTREFEGRSSEEQEFFAVHGYWPEEPVESAQPGAAGSAPGGAQAGPAQ